MKIPDDVKRSTEERIQLFAANITTDFTAGLISGSMGSFVTLMPIKTRSLKITIGCLASGLKVGMNILSACGTFPPIYADYVSLEVKIAGALPFTAIVMIDMSSRFFSLTMISLEHPKRHSTFQPDICRYD